MTNTTLEKWEEKSVCDICNVYQPQTISSKDLIPDGKYTVFGANGIIGRYNSYNHEKSEVLVTCRGATCGSINKSLPFSWINGNAMVVSPKDENIISKDYLYHFLAATDFTYFITGAAQPQITRVGLSPLKISYPPLPEQERIVAKLDKAFEAIDKVKANAEQNLTNAKELFESALNKTLKNIESTGEFKQLSTITEVKDGTHDSPKYVKDGIAFITQKNIKENGFNFITDDTKFITEKDHNKFYQRSNVKKNDILISMIGANRGMACIVDVDEIFSIKNVGLVKDTPNIDRNYLLYFLKSHYAKRYILEKSKGGAQEFVGLTALRAFPILYISINEQQKIVEKLDALQEQTRQLEQIYTQKIKERDELKQSILQKAFRGEL